MLVIKDFATTILASALTAAATSVVVSDASRLPALSAGDYYYLVLQKFTDRTSVEVVKVTGVSGNTLAVVRAQAGTTAKSFAIGDYAEQRVTVGTFSEYIAQSVAGKVDKSDGYVEQSLGLLNTGDLVKATVGISYDATNGHGTVLSGGEGANKLTPHILLRPLGMADASVQAKYGSDGSLILTGGTRYLEAGRITSKHDADALGWPNNTPNSASNFCNRARQRILVGNNGLFFIADAGLNARRFGIQSGHEHPGYATLYGALDLNPFGGVVRVNGGTVYHTNYVPTPAAVGALALSGGVLTGHLEQNMGGYGVRMTAAVGAAFLQGGKVGGDTTDQKLKITGISATALTEFEIVTAGHGVAKINGARIYTEQYVPTPSVLGAVPQARTINSKPLTANITLSAADVGAVAKTGDTMTGDLVNSRRFIITDAIGSISQFEARNGDMMAIFRTSGGGAVLGAQTGGAWDGYIKVGKDAGFSYTPKGGSTEFQVYHQGFKPTPADVGALASSGTAVNAGGVKLNYRWSTPEHDFNDGGNTGQDLKFYWHGAANVNGPTDGSGAKTSGYGITYGNGVHGGQFELGYGSWPQFRSLINGNWSEWNKLYHTGFKPTPADVGALPVNANAVSATKLATARTINGTNFDGTANITTANWGTARTLTIGDAAKSVNGGGNVAWTLDEIGGYHPGNILGDVGFSADKPSGAVIFRRNGVNGNVVKFADGTIILTKGVTWSGAVNKAWGALFESDTIDLGFMEDVAVVAAAFVEVVPTISGSIFHACATPFDAVTGKIPSIKLLRATPTDGIGVDIFITAIGRWR